MEKPYPIYGDKDHHKKLKPGLYLGLFHGFRSPEERAESGDWGKQGPVIGPLEFVHTTYAVHVHILFSNKEDARLYGFDDHNPTLEIDKEDCLMFDNMQYGDWTVFTKK